MSKRKNKKQITPISVLAFFIVVVCIVCFVFLPQWLEDKKVKPSSATTLQINVLQLGNYYAGDCIYIKAGDTDVLIDGGSRANSAPTVKSFLNKYVTDGILEYVIVTHADQDHIAMFAGNNSNPSLFEEYKCKTIIDFPRTNKTTTVYNNYVAKRDASVQSGKSVHYTALQCWNNQDGASRTYTLADGIKLDILYNYFYEHNSTDENNYSVCCMLTHDDKHFLLTGDLEEKGEEYLVQYNTLPQVEFFKAGHHGSKTSSNECLLTKIKPKYVAVSCVAGSEEYTEVAENTFPTQAMIDRISQYTDAVYVTSVCTDEESKSWSALNGNITITSNKSGVSVSCSNNNTKLKDTTWFNTNRTCPTSWK